MYIHKFCFATFEYCHPLILILNLFKQYFTYAVHSTHFFKKNLSCSKLKEEMSKYIIGRDAIILFK